MQANENALTPEQIIRGMFFIFCIEAQVSLKEADALLCLVSGPQRLKDFNAQLGMKNSTGTSTLDVFELEARLKRAPSKTDRRAINVSLTKKGSQFLKQFALRISFFVESLDEEKGAQLIKSFKKFIDTVSALK